MYYDISQLTGPVLVSEPNLSFRPSYPNIKTKFESRNYGHRVIGH